MPQFPQFEVTIENFRSIPFGQKISLELGGGITFILGRNNAGKSNILRFFAELNPLWEFCASHNLAQLPQTHDIRFRDTTKWDGIANFRTLNNAMRISISHNGAAISLDLTPVRQTHTTELQVKSRLSGFTEAGYVAFQTIFDALKGCVYIPSARSTRNQPDQLYNIITGNAFVGNWRHWAGGATELRQITDAVQEDLRTLFGYKRLSIHPASNDSELIVRTDEGVFNLSDHGEGLTHFVLALSNVAIRRPALIFIDEPENSLHPKLQITFVQALARYASGGLVASSHSVGLARSVADEIYFLSREGASVRLNRFGGFTLGSPARELSEMGYSQFSELGGTGILLVEGRTDVKAYREVLRHFGLDQSFIIIGLGGGMFFTTKESDIVHELEEIKRFNPVTVGVVYDSGRTLENSAADHRTQVFHRVCEQLGFLVHATRFHSIENYVSQEALDKVAGAGCLKLGPYEARSSRPSGNWNKNLNWQLFAGMTRAELESTDLGQFCETRLKPALKIVS